MDNLRNQMAALVQGIATSAHERERVIGDIKGQTANMLRAFGRERTAMDKALKAGLAADCMSRSADMLAIRDNTSTMCEGFRQDHVRMRRSLRQSLDQSRETVVTTVASLRVDFAKERADFAKVHRHMAKAQRAGLIKDRRYRSHAVGELMNDFHVSRGKMAQELTESLAKFRQETKAQVSGMSWPGASLLKTSEGVNLPASLLAVQPAEEFAAPISAPGLEPEKGGKEGRQEKTAIGKAIRHIVGKPGKPKKK